MLYQDIFPGSLSGHSMNLIADIFDKVPNISIVTQIEALSWVNAEKEKIVEEFIGDSNIMPITQQIVEMCVRLRRNRNIKTPDAIIAATAIVHEMVLVTCDKDFSDIKYLKVLYPDE